MSQCVVDEGWLEGWKGRQGEWEASIRPWGHEHAADYEHEHDEL